MENVGSEVGQGVGFNLWLHHSLGGLPQISEFQRSRKIPELGQKEA